MNFNDKIKFTYRKQNNMSTGILQYKETLPPCPLDAKNKCIKFNKEVHVN